MANVLSIAYFVLGSVIAHTSILLWVMLLPAGWIQPTGQRAEQAPFRIFLSGVIVAIVGIALFGGLLLVRQNAFRGISEFLGWMSTTLSVKRIPNDASMVTHAIGWLLLTPFLACFLVGEAGMVESFACRLQQRWDVKTRWWPRILGAFTLSFGYFLPILGWFVFLPVIGLISLGSGTVTLLFPGAARTSRGDCESGETGQSVRSEDLLSVGIGR